MTPQERVDITRAVQRCLASPKTDPDWFDGLNQLIGTELQKSSVTDLEPFCGHRALLVGWLQESTSWDLVLFQRESPVLAVAYTTVKLDTDEDIIDREANRVVGIAKDTQLAQRHGMLPAGLRRAHVHVHEQSAGGLSQAVTMSQRMRDSGLYDLNWIIGITREPPGFSEPARSFTWDHFAADLRSGIA